MFQKDGLPLKTFLIQGNFYQKKSNCKSLFACKIAYSLLMYLFKIVFKHQGKPYCHNPCYSALFGPGGFGRGGTESHKY